MPGTTQDLLSNNLFLSFLSGAGASLAGPDSAAAGINSMNQQFFGAKSMEKKNQQYMKMLQDMLAGGGKINMDKDNFNIKAPTSLLKGDQTPSLLNPTPDSPSIRSGVTGYSAGDSPSVDMNSYLNPSNSSVGSSDADLAGLTSQDVSQALTGAINVNQLLESKISDVAARSLKERELAMTERLTDAQIGKIRAEESRLTPSITIPGTDIKLTREDFVEWYKAASKDERTAAIKNFEYATEKGFKGSFEQFQDLTSTTHKKDYDQAVKGGYKGEFNEWMLEMAKAGAINLGDIVERKKATEDIEAQKYFTNPKGLAADVGKHISSDEIQNKLIRFSNDPKKLKIETVRASEEFIVGKITGAGGKILESKLEGRNFVWKVEWPDGTTSEVKHAN